MYAWLRRLISPSSARSAPRRARAAAHDTQSAQAAVNGATAAAPTAPAKPQGITWQQRNDINAIYIDGLFGGEGHPSLIASQSEKDILAVLDKMVKSNQSGGNLVRRMPGVIPQLLQSLRSDNFSGAQLARKISHDVVLVAAVIRMANSSYCNPAKPINSIEHAVLVLGQNGLRQLITSMAFKPIIDMQSGHYTKHIAPQLWEQSVKCAMTARMLAASQRIEPFEAFLAGLIQNVGLIVSLRVIDQVANGKQVIGSESFCIALIEYARTLSASIGREWNFPDSVTQAILEQADTRAGISGMGKILATGDYLSKIHMLEKQERLPEHLADYGANLSEIELICLDVLRNLKEDEI
ncbi:MAG: HDOD domain-containing protein [Proteobacteria bacterium]|nr:HDOD domain-containing protein [Pseudomonadota bacterium]